MQMQHNHNLDIQPLNSILGGLFLGKAFNKYQNIQKTILEIDRFIVSHDGFGQVGSHAYKVQWLGDQSQITYSFLRQISGPRHRLLELVKDENDQWEAYIINPTSDRKGNISSVLWDWSGNLPLNWHKMSMFQFTKL